MAKKLSISIIILIITLTQSVNAQTYNVEVKIPNISKIKGEILVAIYNSNETFLIDKQAFRKYIKPVENKEMNIIIYNLPKGDYSIAIFHDENSNNKMNRNFLGIPSEDYGFSNITSMLFSKPSYEDTKFYLKSDTTMIIKLH